MLNLQTFLQKKKGQDTAENNHHTRKAHKKRMAMLSMAAVGVVPFLAPPVGTDPSVSALAAADSIDVLSGEKEPAVVDALVIAAISENEEAAKVIKAHMAASSEQNAPTDSYRVVAEYTAQTWKSITQNIRESLLTDLEDELFLLRLIGEDGLSEDDFVIDAGNSVALKSEESKASKTAENEQDTAAQAVEGEDEPQEVAVDEKEETIGTVAVKEDKEQEMSAGGEGKLPETDINGQDAEEAFLAKLDVDIPAELTMRYNAAYASLKLSSEQLTVLETIVEAEAGDEDVYGKILVANVVLNRVLDKEFPDTVKEVVFQNDGNTYQFSPIREGGRYYTVKVSAHTQGAVARALAGEDYSDGALYFFARRYTSEKKANWFDTALRKIVEYGCHEFFGNK